METISETFTTQAASKFTLKASINNLLKRAMDILFSLLGLLVLWPFFVYVAYRIKKDDAGPVFFRGERAGLGGKTFKILKFRTMYERPQSYLGARVTAVDDDRITPLGRWLRDTKLNELPQLWNVLVGDMSLVGPRPEDPEIMQKLPQDYQEEILSVRPGITCPTSVAYHDEERLLKAGDVMGDYLNLLPDKMRMDRLYVRHHNLISDFDTIFWTIIVLIPRMGKQKIQEGWLYDGPIMRFIRQYFTWFVIDLIISSIGVVLVGVGWRMIVPLDVGVLPAMVMGLFMALSFSVANTLLGLRTVSWQRAMPADLIKLILSCVLVAMIFIGAQMLYPSIPGLPPSFLILTSVVVLGGFVTVRYRMRILTMLAAGWFNVRKSSYGVGERVLVIGSGNGGEFTTWMLRRSDFKPYYNVIGYVDDDPRKQGMRFDGIKVLGTTADLASLVQRHEIGMLFFAIGKIDPIDRDRILDMCRKTNLPVVIIPEVIENVRKMFLESVKVVQNS